MVVMPDSPQRLARLEQLVAGHDGPLDRGFWERTLGDHGPAPFPVCCHPDPSATSDPDRYATVMAVIMDPAARRLWLASGNPCEAPFELLDYADFLGSSATVVAVAARERRPGGELADRERHVRVAGRIAALAGELAHDGIRIARRPRPRVVAAHLRRDRLVRLAQQRPALVDPRGVTDRRRGFRRTAARPRRSPLRWRPAVHRERRDAVPARLARDHLAQHQVEPRPGVSGRAAGQTGTLQRSGRDQPDGARAIGDPRRDHPRRERRALGDDQRRAPAARADRRPPSARARHAATSPAARPATSAPSARRATAPPSAGGRCPPRAPDRGAPRSACRRCTSGVRSAARAASRRSSSRSPGARRSRARAARSRDRRPASARPGRRSAFGSTRLLHRRRAVPRRSTRHRSANRYAVWPCGALAKASTFAGSIRNTAASPRSAEARSHSKCQALPYFASNASAIRCRSSLSLIAPRSLRRPTSRPLAHCGCRVSAPPAGCARDCGPSARPGRCRNGHLVPATAISGVTCGRPSARTVREPVELARWSTATLRPMASARPPGR